VCTQAADLAEGFFPGHCAACGTAIAKVVLHISTETFAQDTQ
jgi:hypothetical protein